MDPCPKKQIFNERHVRVICIGAGASGLCLAYKLQKSFRNFSLKIYEKNADIGGTWFENRYPGCACDVPAHNYVYSFEPKADFSSVYSSSAEIRGYFGDFANKYNLRKYIKTSHRVNKTQWRDADCKWEVEAVNLETGKIEVDECQILIHAGGYLNNPAWPNIPSLENYAGLKLHSASYDENVSLEGKNVLLIGAGSSAVQILPAIQPVVKSVTIFIRSPVWILPEIGKAAGKYEVEEIEAFVQDPERVLNLRRANERTMNSIFSVYLKGSILQAQAQALLESEMKKVMQNEELERRLIPTFDVGCKRVIPSGLEYLKVLRKDNVSLVFGSVTSFTSNGCTSSDGGAHTGDVIICATGFDTSFIPRYPVLGPGGRDMKTEWAKSITGYMGVGAGGFPNMFTMLGPYTPLSNGATLVCVEAQADYICAFIDRYQTEPIRTFAPKQAVCDEFKAHVASFMEKSVWTDECRNSHNNHSIRSRVPTTWPGSTLHYLEAIREPRFDDWDVEYTGNRFSWLGNGISQTEWDPTADLGYYIRQRDDGPWSSRFRRIRDANKHGSLPPRELHRQAKLAAVATNGEHKARKQVEEGEGRNRGEKKRKLG